MLGDVVATDDLAAGTDVLQVEYPTVLGLRSLNPKRILVLSFGEAHMMSLIMSRM
jgi:hypothetical protein